MEDALGVGHRVLLALAAMLALLVAVGGGLLGLYALCGLPKVGHWLFVLVVPVTVIIIGLSLTAMAAIVAPLAGPTAWAGASAWQSIRTLLRLMRHRLLQAAVLSAGLSVATALVGLACTAFVMVGGWVMAQASVYMLGVDVQPEVLMAGLFGYGLHNISAAGIPADAVPYIQAATIGGGAVFALALVIPTVVYLRGVCEIYLALMAADDVAADSLLLARRGLAWSAPAGTWPEQTLVRINRPGFGASRPRPLAPPSPRPWPIAAAATMARRRRRPRPSRSCAPATAPSCWTCGLTCWPPGIRTPAPPTSSRPSLT
jgi:hypothetical protein